MDILQRMPFLAQDAVFRRLSEIADVASLSKEERREYDKSLKHYRDTIAVMHGQWLEGYASGLAEDIFLPAYLGTTDQQRIEEATRRIRPFVATKVPFMIYIANRVHLMPKVLQRLEKLLD